MGQALRVELSTHNLGEQPLTFSEALHTYLRVGDISKIEVIGLEGSAYVDQMAGRQVHEQSGAIRFAAEVDRVYIDTPDTVIVRDAVRNRALYVEKAGSLSTVVWNPWIEKSQRLGDIGAEGYTRLVCVETANAEKNSVTLAPGGHHRMSLVLSAEPLR